MLIELKPRDKRSRGSDRNGDNFPSNSLRKKKTTCGWKRILFLVTTILKFVKIVVGF